jgi:hypothetical protein
MGKIWVLTMLPWDNNASFGFSVDREVHIWELKDCMSDEVVHVALTGTHSVCKVLEHGKEPNSSSTNLRGLTMKVQCGNVSVFDTNQIDRR